MEDLHKEEDFYKDDGWPTETLRYCDYRFCTGDISEYGEDFDQFALIDNALYPFIRLVKKRGNCLSPCGGMSVVASSGTYARKTDEERDEFCPKIAWGFAAVYLANLVYDKNQDDYVELTERKIVIREYYNKYLKIYLNCHNGLKYSNITKEQKELYFISEHETIVRKLWEKSTPLQKYSPLYEYASQAELEYEVYLRERRNAIMNKRMVEQNVDKEVGRNISQNGSNSIYIENNFGEIIIGLKSK